MVKINDIPEHKPETIPEFKLDERENIPWLTSDKIDASIGVRGLNLWKWYSTWAFYYDGNDIEIDCWFEPKIIRVDAWYVTIQSTYYSKTTIKNENWTLTLMWTTWYWDNSTIKLFDLNEPWEEIDWYITAVSNTWFTIWNITFPAVYTWFWLNITVLW